MSVDITPFGTKLGDFRAGSGEWATLVSLMSKGPVCLRELTLLGL